MGCEDPSGLNWRNCFKAVKGGNGHCLFLFLRYVVSMRSPCRCHLSGQSKQGRVWFCLGWHQ